MAKTCEQFEIEIVDWILGTASRRKIAEIEAHLAGCNSCRDYHRRIAAQHEKLKGFAADFDVQIERQQQRIIDQLPGIVQTTRSAGLERRHTMIKRLSKLSIAAVVLIGVGLMIHWFGDAGGSVAFADVIQKICGSRYSFDLRFDMPDTGTKGQTIKGSILEPGRMRLDCAPMPGLGAISSIVDAQTGKCLILFHQQKAAELLTHPVPNRNSGGGGFMAFLSGPVKELWNLRDGTEKPLGKKTIDGVEVEGFEVHLECDSDIPQEEPLQFTVQIWADIKTATPALVEIAMDARDGSGQGIRWIMNHFQMDAQLDETLFNMEPPAGYTLSHQKDLNEVIQVGKASPEGEWIVEAVTLAAQKKMDDAITKLRTVDWGKPIVFDGTAYIFTMTEKQYITLKPDDQQKAMQKVMDDSAAVRQIARQICEKARPLIEAGKVAEAERMLQAGEGLGRLLTNDPERMILVRLVGIAVQKLCLQERVTMYEKNGSADQLAKAKEQLLTVQALGDEIKKQATGK